ncbi:MAG: TonB-dependent receptor [Bacteroidales bacterium]|jgi:hypothetical protein|nr:TonB-dependent receptor [Bacteroidales bacterium]
MMPDKLFIGNVILCLVFLLFALPVRGQTDDDVITTQDSIAVVTITGERLSYDLSSPTPVQSLRGKALERVNSLSVADAVRYFSGMQVKDYGGIGGLKTVNIRSMGSQHVGVFYDGIQLGNAQNGVIDLGKFSLDNMEAIDMYNAQKSDIFQSAKDFGSAGTIYMTSVKPAFREGEKTKIKVQNRTALFEGTRSPLIYGLTNPSVLWQQKLGDNVSGSFSAEYTNSNGKYRFEDVVYSNNGSVAYDTVEIRQKSDIGSFRAEAGLSGTITGGEWNSKLYFYDSERGIPGPTVREVSWRDQRMWDRNFFVQSSFRKKIGERYDFKVNGKYAYDYTRFMSQDPALKYYDNRYKQQELYLSLINLYRIFPVWKVNLSTDFQYNRMYANLENFSEPQRYTTLVALATSLDLDRLNLQASVLGNIVREKVKMNAASPDKNVFTPAFFASYKPFKKESFYIRAFYKKIFRMPTFNDLYYTLIGNSALKPELAVQYNAGITGERFFNHPFFYRVSISADGYYNEIKNKIVAFPGGQQFRWTMLNLGKVEIKGIDISIDATCRIGQLYITPRLSYTHQKAIDVTDPTDNYYRDQIPYTPWHDGSVTLNLLYRTWNLNYSFIYVGERYDSPANIRENYLQPWYTHDMSVTKDIEWSKVRFKITAEVNNLLNQYYAVILNYPMPGRNYRLTLTLNI